MSEHDDALLDEDIASLPDISDEEYDEDVHSDEDFSTIDHQNNECKINIVENEHDVLHLEVFDEVEAELSDTELNKNLKNNKDLNQQIFDENNKDDKPLIYPKYNDQSQSSDDDIPEYDLRLKLHNLYRQRVINNVEDLNIQEKPIMSGMQSDNNLMPYLNAGESVSPITRCDVHEPDRYSFMENQMSCNLTNFSYPQIVNRSFNNFQAVENFNPHIISFSDSLSRPFINEPVHKFLPDQSQFLYNQNMSSNYKMYHPQMQPLPYPVNQNFSVNSPFPVHQTLPINQSFPFMPHMGGVMSNSNIDRNITPHHSQSMNSYQSHGYPNLVQYNTVKPFNFNGHKILVNRDFRKSETGREVKILPNDVEYNEFLKINSSFPNDRKHFKYKQHMTNFDPYAYFSDVWQEKKTKKNVRSSFSPEVIFSSSNEYNKNKSKLRKQNDKRDLEMFLIDKDEGLQKRKVSFSNRNDNENLRNIKKDTRFQKRKSKSIVVNQSIDRNNNSSKRNDFKKQKSLDTNTCDQKGNINAIPNKELELDPQLKEYCRKVEEQKLQREKYLLEKENRRKILAMERLGIRKKPFIEAIDLESQGINDLDINAQEIKGNEDPPIIELSN